MKSNCPECNKNDRAQKLSSIVTSGTSTGSYAGPSGGVIYMGGKSGIVGGYSVLQGHSTTVLANLLYPPPEPELRVAVSSGKTFIIMIIAIILGICGWFGMLDTGIGNETAIIILIIVIGGVFITIQVNNNNEKPRLQKEYELNKSFWDQAIKKWSRLYYCERDDIIFDPQTNEITSPGLLLEFLGYHRIDEIDNQTTNTTSQPD